MVRFMAATLLVAAPCAAQEGTQQAAPGQKAAPAGPSFTGAQPLRTSPVNPRAAIFGASRRITVTWMGLQTPGPITLSSPAGNFACEKGAFAPFVNQCTLLVPVGSTTTLRALWMPNTPPLVTNGVQVGGAQWGGACSGTAADTCTLTMTENRTVSIDVKKPGGVPVPIGTAED